jgi:Methylase involved in ubiquinone/menaquinone biosynthesis
MNLYTFLSIGYDLLDKIWLSEKGRNPRDVIEELIPNEKCKVLDLCCGTFTNGLFIAKKNPKNLVVGLDRSEPMLREGRRKIDKAGISNVELMCLDATKTGIEEESFDYAIIGLVLHECNPELWKSILAETRRILKPNGRIIILEWERPDNLKQRIKFAPLYITEVL